MEVDKVVCALVPEPLDAVSLFYREFGATDGRGSDGVDE